MNAVNYFVFGMAVGYFGCRLMYIILTRKR